MASKSRSNLSETPNKASLATPRVSKASKGVSKSESESSSPLRNPRLSVERSPRSVNSKATVDRKSPRPTSTPPDKLPQKPAKGSELQNQLNLVQEDLKKAKEQLIQSEKEKVRAIDELEEAKRVAEEANEKLGEVLLAQKWIEEDSEIAKFQALELEQGGLETVKKEEEWQKEIESVRNQHAVDVAALLSTTKELQRVKQELAMTCDTKNQALNHADDATKIAEIHVEKAEILSAELLRVKALLDSKLETEANDHEIKLKLKKEIEALKQEVEKAKDYDEKLIEKETSIEQLNVQLEAAKMAESYAHSLLDEWKMMVKEQEMNVKEANKSERSALESLKSVMNQLEASNDLLHDADSEIVALKEKMGLLEMTIGRHRADIEESDRQILMAKEESIEMSKKAESLKSELEKVKEEKAQALNNEKLTASSVQTLLFEKNKLINELENSRDVEEKSKKAMESLASALHEVSAEARETKEKLLNSQVEHESYETQIEDLKLVLNATSDKYKSMLDDARGEIDVLTCKFENSKNELENSKAEWEQRELHLVSCLNKSEEEKSSLGKEINRLVHLQKAAEEQASSSREEECQLKENLKEVEAEAIHLQEALKEVMGESMKLKESLLDKENELQSLFHVNDELQMREAEYIKKVEELSKLLEEAATINKNKNNHTEENGDLSDSDKDYDLLPKVVGFSEENGHGEDNDANIVLNDNAGKIDSPKPENVNGKLKEDEREEKDESAEVEYKMWESCKIEKRELLRERESEPESLEEEVDQSKIEGSDESLDKINGTTAEDGGSSPSKQQQLKKKKHLLGKFGSLLKKKGAATNHK
ncbi:hypothetical protein TanjilG_23361 [Lupinus angustifolius]|uniref:WEB family protein n=1 Tax=Lupinus angustifolius TaxID=3871 RepID=A0A4P1R9L5_LUPAN|nr:PREDICTED: WEB family protein At3g02930, chloroplastic-like [Lupinus angustifolius]OIW05575.1 hypothetical protein TanjilG_23361 [Lupinus angustifolius]